MKKLAQFKWAILLAVIGLLLVGVGVISFARAFRATGTSFTAPGETKVTIAKPGDYTLWHETKTILDGKFRTFPDELPADTTITVLKEPEGTPVPLSHSGKASVEWNGQRRVSAAQITFSAPGEYKIVVSGLQGKRPFYLDEAKFLRSFLNLLLYGAGGGVFLFAAVAYGIYVLVRMSR